MICKTCNEYYRISEYNNSLECENCVDQIVTADLDSEDQAELEMLINPSGHTKAVFYD